MKINADKALLALRLFDCKAVQFGAFKLKLHETKPDAPLSPIYLNLRTPENPKAGPLTKEIVAEIVRQLLVMVKDRQLYFDHVAGVPRAGDPFAEALAFIGGWNLLRMVKEATPDKRQVTDLAAGSYQAGEEVGLADDLITQADSKFEAIAVLESHGLAVRHVLVLVDREQGGAEQLRQKGYELHSVFTLPQLLSIYVETGKIKQGKADEVLEYLRISQQ